MTSIGKLSTVSEFANTLLTGNRCGHQKAAPRFYTPKKETTILYIFNKLIKALGDAYHKSESQFISALNALNTFRNKRSERKEAIVAVSQTLVHYLEAWTLRTGYFDKEGNFTNYTLTFIAREANLINKCPQKRHLLAQKIIAKEPTLQTEELQNRIDDKLLEAAVNRARRAITDLMDAGYLIVKRHSKITEEGTYKGLASTRELTYRFFKDLGIDAHKIYQLREWKRKQLDKMLAAKNKAIVGKTVNLISRKKPFNAPKPLMHEFTQNDVYHLMQDKASEAKRDIEENKLSPLQIIAKMQKHLRK
ncbi:MAG: hypothetical protein LEGION0398_MBIBDBAK_00252 [Legionellaceae bacterium]